MTVTGTETGTETETASYKTSVTDDPAFTAAASTVEPVMTITLQLQS